MVVLLPCQNAHCRSGGEDDLPSVGDKVMFFSAIVCTVCAPRTSKDRLPRIHTTECTGSLAVWQTGRGKDLHREYGYTVCSCRLLRSSWAADMNPARRRPQRLQGLGTTSPHKQHMRTWKGLLQTSPWGITAVSRTRMWLKVSRALPRSCLMTARGLCSRAPCAWLVFPRPTARFGSTRLVLVRQRRDSVVIRPRDEEDRAYPPWREHIHKPISFQTRSSVDGAASSMVSVCVRVWVHRPVLQPHASSTAAVFGHAIPQEFNNRSQN